MSSFNNFVSLPAYLNGIYFELTEAYARAQALQVKYKKQMALHQTTVKTVDSIDTMRVDLLSVKVHFKVVQPPFSFLENLKLLLRIQEKYPEGIYLRPSGSNEAELTLTVSLRQMDGQIRQNIESPKSINVNYYVTKTV